MLSRAAAPNRVVACPSVAHCAHARVDAYTCGVVCDSGFELQSGACVSQCAGLNTTCEPGYVAEVVCVQGPQTLYNCSACPPRAGFGAAPFDSGVDASSEPRRSLNWFSKTQGLPNENFWEFIL